MFLFEIKDSTVSITGYTGDEKEIIIPSHINDLPVVSIESCAFKGKCLESVSIPYTVKSIGYWAFYQNRISSLKLEEGLEIIKGGAFLCNPLKNFTLPDSVKSIGWGAFPKCKLFLNK